MAATVGIGRPVLAACAFLGDARALPRCTGRLRGCAGRTLVAAVRAHHLAVYLAGAAVALAAVAGPAQQLDVAAVVRAPAREGRDVVKLQVGSAAAALALAAIAGKHHLLGGLRHVAALRIAAHAQQQQQQYKQFSHGCAFCFR